MLKLHIERKLFTKNLNATDAFCNIYIEGANYLQFTLMMKLKMEQHKKRHKMLK